MKTLTVQIPKDQLSRVISEAHHGDVIILTDGERRLSLETSPAEGGALDLDLDEDSPELAAELLKAVGGPFTPYSRKDLEAIANQVQKQKHRK